MAPSRRNRASVMLSALIESLSARFRFLPRWAADLCPPFPEQYLMRSIMFASGYGNRSLPG